MTVVMFQALEGSGAGIATAAASTLIVVTLLPIAAALPPGSPLRTVDAVSGHKLAGDHHEPMTLGLRQQAVGVELHGPCGSPSCRHCRRSSTAPGVADVDDHIHVTRIVFLVGRLIIVMLARRRPALANQVARAGCPSRRMHPEADDSGRPVCRPACS